MRLAFDIEANGLLDTVTKCHVIVAIDIDTDNVYVFRSNDEHNNLDEGIKLLQDADELIGHNIIGYDVPAIKKLFGVDLDNAKLTDTLVLGRVGWSDLFMDDMRVYKRKLEAKDYGSHSLRAWGRRLGNLKGDYSENGSWELWSQDMEDYCIQDVRVTITLYNKIMSLGIPEKCIDLELEFNRLMSDQEQYGFKFNAEMAEILYRELNAKKVEIQTKLRDMIPPKLVEMKTKTKVVPFNPASRQQICELLIEKYKWNPIEFTPKGSPKVSESVLLSLPYQECKPLAEFFQINKILGMLHDGPTGWLKLQKKGRIHGHVNTGGTVTGRCSHTKPNVAQVPSVRSKFGTECRSLFEAGEGNVLVGCDAAGLESRCLAHYLYKFDGGTFTNELLNGDIHSTNAKAFGGISRDLAKTALYAMLYGCSAKKLALILGRSEGEGRQILDEFYMVWPQLKELTKAVKAAAKSRGYLIGLDRRKLPVRSEHAALNTLLQSTGAIIMKNAAVELVKLLDKAGLKYHEDYAMVANIHDEFQIEVKRDKAKLVARAAEQAITNAGKVYNFKCPLGAEAKIGYNWAETH
jgi:DNA polymerase I-like protein with 3'-5' exonuclease and polymerase domains